jgi:hypothetical protein
MARAPLYDNGRLLTAENMQLLILTALVAFLLHKFLLGEKYDGDAAYVLGSAAGAVSEDDHQVKTEHLAANQNQDSSPNKEAHDKTSEGPVQKIQVKSATKEAASIRNYDRLLTPAQPANAIDEQPCEETKAGSEAEEEKLTEEKQAEDPAFYLNFSNFTTAPIEDGHSSSEMKQDTNSKPSAEKPDEVPSYLNFSNFMTASISGVAGPAPPPVKMHSKAEHPGLEAYYRWKSTLTSLYRVYAVPLHSYPHTSYGTNQIKEAVLPMHPSSERGQTAVYIEVTNFTSNDVAVYWVDYKGRENYKGRIKQSEVWHQTTYIGHPWTFRKITNDNNVASDESILLKYVPFRVIPSIEGAETVTEDESVGMQRFALKEVPNDFGVIVDGRKWRPACFVEDAILPEPPSVSLRGEVDSSRSSGENVPVLFHMSCSRVFSARSHADPF